MRKKKVTVIALAMLLLATMLIPAGCISVTPAGDKIAVISLSGSITAGGSSLLWGSAITPSSVREQLNKAERDAAVKAIVLRVDSPGGAVVPCQEISAEIEKVKQSKPVVVSMGSMAASGGYYISAKADKIVALPGTSTGSIGVISTIPNVKGLYDKLGIEMQTFTGGKHKDMYSGLRELTPEEKEIMQQMVDDYYEQFVEMVAEGRGLSNEQVRNLATGQLYTGDQARELGLVDELGGLDTAIDLAAELAGVTAPQIEYYRPPKSLLESLLGLNLGSLVYAVQMRLLGLSGQDIALLQALSHTFPEPQYLVSLATLP
ncbi:MAG: signal peptide peptidase SppA [Dehalococcoidia bacterium]|nr:signal peptide peptidase SppA [Dehalococcoidia bacterium]